MERPHLRALLAAICICALCGTALAEAGTGRPSGRTLAKRKLAREGYVSVALRCATKNRRTTCTWSGVRAQSRCAGTVVVARKPHKGRSTRLTDTRCSPVLVGFNTFTNARTLGLQRSTGATVSRIIIPWAFAEPLPGAWNWTEFDRQYEDALDAGMRPLIVAMAAPCWARGQVACADAVVGGPPDAAHESDWREYVRRLVDRYPRSVAVEIWNEPNLTQLFWPRPDPVRFAHLLAQAYTVIKATRPAMPVISGGLLAAGVSGESPGGMGDVTFLRGMLAAGAGASMDAIGVHPYPREDAPDGAKPHWNPDVAERTLGTLRSVQAEFEVRKPFWITEVGESTSTQSGFPTGVSPDQQAADIMKILRNAVTARDVDVIVIHTLLDEQSDGAQNAIANVLQPTTGFALFYNGVNSGFGVFDAHDRPKPAACALSHVLGGTLIC